MLVKNPNFSNLSFPESTGPCAAGSRTRCAAERRLEEEEERREEKGKRKKEREEDGYELPPPKL